MSSLRRLVIVAGYFASATATTAAFAGAKDESAAEWLAPKWLNEWHDGLAAKGLNFGATYVGDNIGNVSGGTSRGFIHLGRFDFSVDADLEKLVGWSGGRIFANMYEIYGRGLTRNYIHNLATISEIEATAASSNAITWLLLSAALAISLRLRISKSSSLPA